MTIGFRERPPRGLAKFFRQRKAHIRREMSDPADADMKIKELLREYWPQYDGRRANS
ncbi:hypothetical protein HYW67_00820 [Candidatus Parcubacteria bacterium]|nr:hypothetical protein [Candidatus Parcubacteria bacterium]